MNYYYLVASLPSLSFAAAPHLSFEAFGCLCREHLSAADRRGLEEIERGPDYAGRHPFVRAWQAMDIQLRNALARHRAARRRLDAEPFYRVETGCSAAVERIAAEAFTKNDPLQRERLIDRFRWDEADELAGFNMFAGRAVLAYAVKLGIAERWSGMKEDVGARVAHGIVSGESKRSSVTSDRESGGNQRSVKSDW